ncbi:MAG: hypothetical protein MZV65_01345 [Chromatiales bacterium]|nr:hypothetical protein [Chromatiales bacterium]
MRYFAGKATPTSDFNYSTGPDVTLGLPKATWKDPYSTTDGFPYCAKPYMLAISDVYPSFDSDKVPGSFFSTFSGDISGLNAASVGQSIWNIEFGSGTTKKVFIGRSGAIDDSAPTAKDATSFGNLRGLAPGEPTREGSFGAAEVAYYARLNNLNPIADATSAEIRMSSFSIVLHPRRSLDRDPDRAQYRRYRGTQGDARPLRQVQLGLSGTGWIHRSAGRYRLPPDQPDRRFLRGVDRGSGW